MFIPMLFELSQHCHRKIFQICSPCSISITGHGQFMALQQGALVQREGQWAVADPMDAVLEQLPARLRPLLLRRVAALSAGDRQVMDAASVAGGRFSTALVAAGLEQPLDTVEARCEALAQQGEFLEAIGLSEGADGALSGCYRFRHTLYQQVLYEQIGEVRRVQLHRRMMAHLDVYDGTQGRQSRAQMAFHLGAGGNWAALN